VEYPEGYGNNFGDSFANKSVVKKPLLDQGKSVKEIYFS